MEDCKTNPQNIAGIKLEFKRPDYLNKVLILAIVYLLFPMLLKL